MARWKTGAGALALVVVSMPALCGCTEPEPLYCDPEHPCNRPGYSCDYSRRTCVADDSEDLGGVPDRGGPDQAAPDASADQGPQPDTQAAPDSAVPDVGAADSGSPDQ